MYRFTTVAAAFFLLLSLYACGSSQDGSHETTSKRGKEEVVESRFETQQATSEAQENDTEPPKKENDSSVEKRSGASSNPESKTTNSLSGDDKELIELGKRVYKEKACGSCHTIGKGRLVGPDLLGVTKRRDEEWLRRWMKNPDEMIRTDPIAKEMLREYMVPMPNQGLTDKEVEGIIAYLKSEDKKNENKN